MIPPLEPLTMILIGFLLLILIGILLLYPFMVLVLLCFVIPLEQFFSHLPLRISPILGGIIVAGYILTYGLPLAVHQSFNKHFKLVKLDYVVMLLFVLSIILPDPEFAWNGVDVHGKQSCFVSTYAQLAVLYYLASRLLSGYNLSWLGLGLMLGTTISAIYGITMMDGIGVFQHDLALANRLKGGQGDPNLFATYALCSLSFLPAIQELCRNKLQKLIVTLLGGFQIILVFLTISKTAMLALGFLLLIWLLYNKSMLSIKKSGIIVIGLCLLSLFIIPTKYWVFMYDTIVGGIFSKEGTMGQRYHYWYGAYLAFKSAPIFGIGIDKFPLFAVQHFPGLEIDFGAVVHNAYLSVLAENGIVGITFFLGMITLAAYRFWEIFKRGKTKNLRILAFSGFSAFVMVLFMSLTLSMQYNKLLWLLAGSSIAITNYNDNLIKRI